MFVPRLQAPTVLPPGSLYADQLFKTLDQANLLTDGLRINDYR